MSSTPSASYQHCTHSTFTPHSVHSPHVLRGIFIVLGNILVLSGIVVGKEWDQNYVGSMLTLSPQAPHILSVLPLHNSTERGGGSDNMRGGRFRWDRGASIGEKGRI